MPPRLLLSSGSSVKSVLLRDALYLERILHKIVGPYVENGFDQVVNGRPVAEEDRKFALAIYTHGITGIFLDWVSAGMRSDTVFLEDNLAHLFQNSLAGIAERCVAQQAGSNN